MRYSFAFFALTAFVCVSAQTPPGSNLMLRGHFGVGPISDTVVRGAPYSAEGQSQETQILADGTQIHGTVVTRKFFRDAEGRTRVERPVTSANAANPIPGQEARTVIEIRDPVAFTVYTLNPETKRVRTRALNPLAPETTAAVSANTPGAQVQPAETLGTQTIEGVVCEGTRTTTVWSTGSIGNDRPITIVSEVWISRELQLVFLSKVSDPRTGERTGKLVHFVAGEPDPNLFQIPSDYGQPADNETPPTVTHKVEPNYTKEARKAKLSGSVLLSVIVDANGKPHDIKVTRSLGFGLDEEAVKAVSKWRFKPGLKNGQAAAVKAQIEVNFRLLTGS